MMIFNKELKYGSVGDDVKWLQSRLISYGFDICFVNETVKKLTADGRFGIITENCLASFQAKVIDAITENFIIDNIPVEYKKDYTANGIMDYPTWFVLKYYAELTEWYNVDIEKPEIEIPPPPPVIDIKTKIINKVIELAKQEIGTVEKGGNNYGKRVQEYQSVGSNGAMTGGAAWCQYFQNWLQITACKVLGISYKGTYSGYTPTVTNWGYKNSIAVKYPKLNQIDIGDMGYVYSANRNNSQHVYLIVGKSDNKVITIEGNTNPGGSREGFGVFKRTRLLGSQCWSVIKWYKLYK
jgi:hypothetical protein